VTCHNADKQREIAFCQQMIDTLRERLLESAGLQSMSVDGLSVTYATGSASVRKELRYYEKRLQQLQGSSYYKSIDLGKGL
jgi:hypothetical protein